MRKLLAFSARSAPTIVPSGSLGRTEDMFKSSSAATAQCLLTALVASFISLTKSSFFNAQVADEAAASKMSGVSKFVEARALDLRLQNALAQAKRILERPPLTEAQKVIIAITENSDVCVFESEMLALPRRNEFPHRSLTD